MAEAAEEKNSRMKGALGIKSDYKDGSAFNQELQAAQRAAEKAKQEEERMAREIEKEKEQEKERKRRLVLTVYLISKILPLKCYFNMKTGR